MTQDWPVTSDYDPTWRSFKGRTDFVPHPSSLEGNAELQWRSVYQRADDVVWAPPPEIVEPPPPPPSVESHPVQAVDWPERIEPPAPLIPESVPSVRSPHPVFEPAVPPNQPLADYSAFRVPAPIPTTPVEKLASLYPPGEAPAPAPPRPKRSKRRWITRPAGIATIVGCIVAAGLGLVVVPKMLSGPPTLKSMFTAPMMVLRAVGAGSIANVAVTIGQAVEPTTVLLTIRTDPLSDTAIDDLKARLAQAKTRQAALDDPPPGAVPTTPRRPRDAAASFQVYDADHPPPTQRQRDAAAAEVDRLQKAIANAGGNGPVDQPILAGVHGIVWSLDAQTGGHLQAGDPLAQLADCGRSFLAVQGDVALLKAGQTVLIRMPGVRPFHGTVRASNGVAEPANTLVVDPTGFSAVAPNACPVGTTAEIQPEARR